MGIKWKVSRKRDLVGKSYYCIVPEDSEGFDWTKTKVVAKDDDTANQEAENVFLEWNMGNIFRKGDTLTLINGKKVTRN